VTRRRRKAHPAVVIGLAAVAVALAVTTAHVIGWVLITAAITAAAYYAGTRTRPTRRRAAGNRQRRNRA
jgi:hypothetical protein